MWAHTALLLPHARHSQAGRDAPYSLLLPVKVANNPRIRELACSGRGFTPRIELSTAAADCGAALPGQRPPAEAVFVLSNPTDRPVEVVCPELDEQHKQDEDALRSLDM